MLQECKDHEVFEIIERRLCDQERAIRKNNWLSVLELKSIRRMIKAESVIVNEGIEDVEENQADRDIVRTSEINEQIW